MMMVTSRCSAAAGSLDAPFNPGRWLQDVAGPLLPGRFAPQLQNAPVVPPRAEEGLARELRALCDGVSSQMIGWGTAIGFSRLVQLAERLAPGISCPWVAYQAFCALSDAARGNLLRAVQAMPVAALMPATAQRTLADGLRPFLPAGSSTATGHQGVVMGLACFALLHELTRQLPVQTPRSRWVPALLQNLRRLRAALNVVGGLQGICNAQAGDRRALAATGHPPGCCPTLLPGADAARRKGKPVLPGRRRPQLSALHPARPRFNVRRVAARNRRIGRLPHSQGRGSHGMPPGNIGDSANKDSLVWTLPKKTALPATPSVRSHGTTTPAARAGTQNVGGADAARPLRPSPGTVVPATDRPASTGPGPSPEGAALLPSCLHFHRMREAEVQLRKLRMDRNPVRFCVHDRARPAFEWMLESPRSSGDDPDHWMVALPVHERYPTALRHARIRKYNGLRQLQASAPRNATDVGPDELFVVLTVSVIADHRLHHLGVPGDQILPRNSFSLIEHTELDGDVRRFIVYFIHRAGGVVQGARAGFLDIERDGDTFSITDPETEFGFSSDNLDDLLAGMEKVSGCRYRPDANALPLLHRHRVDDLPPTPSLNRFVGAAAAHTLDTHGRGSVHFNAELRLIETVAFVHSGGHGGRLLRTCFTLVGQDLIAVDDRGAVRTLRFSADPHQPGLHVLSQHRGFDAQFLREHGLMQGERYPRQEIIDILENYGMTFLPLNATVVPTPVARMDAFYIEAPALHPEPATDPGTIVEVTDAQRLDALSSFRVQDDRISYVDHDGSRGVLMLSGSVRQGQRLMVAAGNSPAAFEFARGNHLRVGRIYTLHAITAALFDNGFVQVAG